MPQASIIIPAYNEAGNIGQLVEETFQTVPDDMIGEVIVVDDASTDRTAADVASLHDRFPKLRLIQHQTNAGQSRAVRSGVMNARFPLIATMDGDGQNPPENIRPMIREWDASDVMLVGGHRTKRRDTWSKRAASRAANALRQFMLRDNCPDTGCGLKVFGRDAYLLLPFFHGQHRYLPALMRAQGFQTAMLPVTDRPRQHGSSKYTNLQRALIGIPDLLGVAWLIRRSRTTQTVEEVRDTERAY